MFFIRHRDIQCMNLDINFLAVIDDNYFMNNAFFYASKIENYADFFMLLKLKTMLILFGIELKIKIIIMKKI